MSHMAQKMAKAVGLTTRQEQLLELVLRQPYILDTFYLSGGTALSSWYLHHRDSEDLDFFTTHPFDYDQLIRLFKNAGNELQYRTVIFNEDYGFLSCNFRYSDNTFLKLDFNNYTRILLEKGLNWKGLEIDSLYDIAVNKLDTIFTRPRTRDYVDLYFIFQTYKVSLNQMIRDIPKKFSEVIDPLQLAKNFLKVTEYTDLPKIYLPFDRQEMVKFYQKLALDLKPKIFK